MSIRCVATLERDCEVEETYTFDGWTEAERFKQLVENEDQDFFVEIHAVTEVVTADEAFEDAKRYHMGVK